MNAERQATLAKALKDILETPIARYQPQSVFLIGSAARGAVGEWSDLDLVIIKETPLPFLQRLKEVALLCRAPVSVDYLVYTPDEFAQMIAENNPFIVHEVVRKGKVLYGRQPPPGSFAARVIPPRP